VSPQKGDDVAPPPVGDEYRVRHASRDAAKGWQDLFTQEPSNTRWAFEEMRNNAGCHSKAPTSRHFQLQREYATGLHAGKELPQYQLEVLSGARVWYLVDHERKVCWIKLAGRGHPKQTE
jgi:hypothetical protein